MEKLISSAGGRKFLVVVGAGIVTTILCATGIVTESVYETVVIGIVGLFITGNVVQAVTAPKKGQPDD
jgi:hypothetical protein